MSRRPITVIIMLAIKNKKKNNNNNENNKNNQKNNESSSQQPPAAAAAQQTWRRRRHRAARKRRRRTRTLQTSIMTTTTTATTVSAELRQPTQCLLGTTQKTMRFQLEGGAAERSNSPVKISVSCTTASSQMPASRCQADCRAASAPPVVADRSVGAYVMLSIVQWRKNVHSNMRWYA